MFLMKHGKHTRFVIQGTLALAAFGAAAFTAPALADHQPNHNPGGGGGSDPCCDPLGGIDVFGPACDGSFSTIADALACIEDALALPTPIVGDYVIELQPGCYDEFVTDSRGDPVYGISVDFEIPDDTTSLTIRAAVPETNVCLGSGESEAVRLARVHVEHPANNVTLEGLTIGNANRGIDVDPRDFGESGWDFAVLEGLTVTGCTISGANGDMSRGVFLLSGGQLHNVLFEDNMIEHATIGMRIQSGEQFLGLECIVRKNTISDCDIGIDLYGRLKTANNSDGWQFIDNTIDASKPIYLRHHHKSMPLNTRIIGNTLTASGKRNACIELTLDDPAGTFSSGNCLNPTSKASFGKVGTTLFDDICSWNDSGIANDYDSALGCPVVPLCP